MQEAAHAAHDLVTWERPQPECSLVPKVRFFHRAVNVLTDTAVRMRR